MTDFAIAALAEWNTTTLLFPMSAMRCLFDFCDDGKDSKMELRI